MRVRRTIAVASAVVTAIALLAIAPGTAAAAPADVFLSEYIEGSSNNKALEMFNGTGAPVDLAAGGYQIEMYFNGNTTAAGTIALTGTVADGDVYVLAHASANATILAQADQTSSASWFNGDDALVLRKGGAGGTIVDSFGQVGLDPGTEWGTGITSTADNTLRRKASVTTGDTTIADAFDPAVDWDGYPTDTIDGLGAHSIGSGPIDAPAVLVCGAPLVTSAGTAATRVVTATDPDDTITGLDITAVVPIPAAGTIARTAVNPAASVGATATADITVSATMPAGSYTVTLTATDTDGVGATCVLAVQVTTVLTVGEVQGPTLDTENGQTDRSPLAPAAGNGASSTLLDVRGVITQKTLSRTSAGAAQHGFFLQSRLGDTDGNPQSSDGIFVFMGSFTSLIGGYAPTVGDEVVLRARVSEFFSLTQLSSAALVTVTASGLDVATAVEITDAVPPTSLADADRYWERHEGARMRVRSGSGATSGRDVFASHRRRRDLVGRPRRSAATARRPVRTSGLPRHPSAGQPAGDRVRRRQRTADSARQPRCQGRGQRQQRAAPAGAGVRHTECGRGGWRLLLVPEVRRTGRGGIVHARCRPVSERSTGDGEPVRGVLGRHLQCGEPVRLPG